GGGGGGGEGGGGGVGEGRRGGGGLGTRVGGGEGFPLSMLEGRGLGKRKVGRCPMHRPRVAVTPGWARRLNVLSALALGLDQLLDRRPVDQVLRPARRVADRRPRQLDAPL